VKAWREKDFFSVLGDGDPTSVRARSSGLPR
jgi:hypothetical protein